MNAQQLVAELEHIVSAPGGMQLVRQMILLFGVSGKLTAISKKVSPKPILTKIRSSIEVEAKKRGIRWKKYHGEFSFKFPLEVPAHWEIAPLNEVAIINMGQSPDSIYVNEVGDGLPFYQGKTEFGKLYPTPKKWCSKPKKIAQKDDILISVRAPVGPTNLCNEDSCIGRGITAIGALKGINKYFLLYLLRALERKIATLGVGSTFVAISQEDIQGIPVPIPDIEEQNIIVSKIDELLAICDELQDKQQRRDKLSDLARTTVFRFLANAKSPFELSEAWKRVAANANILIERPQSIESYKNTILDLAMSGLLLKPNEKADSTGRNLLQEIAEQRVIWSKKAVDQEQKEALAMLKKIRVQKLTIPDSTLPDNWAWGSLLQISQAVVDCHNKTAPYVNDGTHLVRTTDIRNGRMDLRHTRKISDETYAYWSRRMPPKTGDVFFTREAPMGEAAIVPEGEKVCLGQRTMLIRLFPELFNSRFLVYAIYSPSFKARMIEAAIGMTVKHLRVGGVEDLIVPVPPKAEQDRIVEIIDTLFEHCDRLALQLAKKQNKGNKLAKASVEAITGIRSEEEEELKVPKTELISKLHIGETPSVKEQAPLATILMQHNGEMTANDLWQRFGGAIDAFYAQLKLEVNNGWILEPVVAEMREVEVI